MNNQTYCSWKHKAVHPLEFNNTSIIHNNSSWNKWWLPKILKTRNTTPQNLNTTTQTNYEKNTKGWLLILRGKSPSPQRKGSKPRPTSAHAKVTWISDMSSTNRISFFIKPYQAPITPIICKLHSNYSVINQEIGFSSTTTTNYYYIKKIIINGSNFSNYMTYTYKNLRIW
jgi:hypothetical protein